MPTYDSEKLVERYLVDKVQLLGGMTLKLMPTRAGIPDRLVLMPGGRVYFVELKSSQGRLSAMQEHFHDVMGYLDIKVAVLFSLSHVADWITEITEQAYQDDQDAPEVD